MGDRSFVFGSDRRRPDHGGGMWPARWPVPAPSDVQYLGSTQDLTHSSSIDVLFFGPVQISNSQCVPGSGALHLDEFDAEHTTGHSPRQPIGLLVATGTCSQVLAAADIDQFGAILREQVDPVDACRPWGVAPIARALDLERSSGS